MSQLCISRNIQKRKKIKRRNTFKRSASNIICSIGYKIYCNKINFFYNSGYKRTLGIKLCSAIFMAIVHIVRKTFLVPLNSEDWTYQKMDACFIF